MLHNEPDNFSTNAHPRSLADHSLVIICVDDESHYNIGVMAVSHVSKDETYITAIIALANKRNLLLQDVSTQEINARFTILCLRD